MGKAPTELNVLVPGPKSDRSNTYQISQAFCFLGEGFKMELKAL